MGLVAKKGSGQPGKLKITENLMGKPRSFHLSLKVSSLWRAIDFYRVLFDMEPAKCNDEYAKFGRASSESL